MATTIGLESDPRTLLKNLIRLEHDAIAAYDAVIDRIEDPGRAGTVRSFREEHEKHLEALGRLAAEHGARNPGQGSMRTAIATGKVNTANLAGGDGAVLKAMSTNETDTVAAYRNACGNAAAPEDARRFFEKALADAERHKSWMDTAADAA